MGTAENGMTDSERDEVERLIVEALAPVTKARGLDVTVLVHPPGAELHGGPRDGAAVRFFFRR